MTLLCITLIIWLLSSYMAESAMKPPLGSKYLVEYRVIKKSPKPRPFGRRFVQMIFNFFCFDGFKDGWMHAFKPDSGELVGDDLPVFKLLDIQELDIWISEISKL